MSQNAKMKAALKRFVVSPLLEQGFTGSFPHYQRTVQDRIELLSFQTNKWGNSFTVEVSVVFPHREGRERNLCFADGAFPERINVWDTNYRYRLKGMFDGWFYYTDVYRIGGIYEAVSDKRAASYVPPKNAKLVQKSSDDLYKAICAEVNRQMVAAYKWWDKMSKGTPKPKRRLLPRPPFGL